MHMHTSQYHGRRGKPLGTPNYIQPSELIGYSTPLFISPAIGGYFSRPAEQFPDVFGNNEFLKKYPYFLACAIPATFSILAWIVTLTFLKEVSYISVVFSPPEPHFA